MTDQIFFVIMVSFLVVVLLFAFSILGAFGVAIYLSFFEEYKFSEISDWQDGDNLELSPARKAGGLDYSAVFGIYRNHDQAGRKLHVENTNGSTRVINLDEIESLPRNLSLIDRQKQSAAQDEPEAVT